jgi:hypothetical protein
MNEAHPHTGATYKIVAQNSKTFGVQVSIPDAPLTTVTGFASKAEAEQWIEGHKKEIAKGAPQRRSYNRPSRR